MNPYWPLSTIGIVGDSPFVKHRPVPSNRTHSPAAPAESSLRLGSRRRVSWSSLNGDRDWWIYTCIYIYTWYIIHGVYIYVYLLYIWLVVLTILKNISQWEGLSHILWKIKKVPNHQPDIYVYIHANMCVRTWHDRTWINGFVKLTWQRGQSESACINKFYNG
jgi:hypothetical protein